MIVGKGLLARAFEQYQNEDDLCIFASGVSNSLETNDAHFLREKSLLESTLESFSGTFVYFSTTSISDPSLKDRLYVRHKVEMEKLIQANTDNHLICRLSYVVGRGGNPNTIINYLVNCMRGGLRFDLWQHAERNFLDVDDVVQLVTQLLAHEACRGVVQIANPVSMTMPKVVEVIEAYLGLKANYTVIDKGAAQEIDTAMIEKYCDDLSRLGDEAYLSGLLQKYYSE